MRIIINGSLVKENDVDSISQCWGEISESHMKKASINIFGISLFFKVMGGTNCSSCLRLAVQAP